MRRGRPGGGQGVANGFLESQVDELRAAVSTGYSRRRYDGRRDRKE
jgi:hypothetical protein